MSTPLLDSHLHLLFPDRFDYYWRRPELDLPTGDHGPQGALHALASAGMEGAIVVQAHPSARETALCAALARKHPFIRGIVAWIDLADARIEERLTDLAVEPLVRSVRDQTAEDQPADWFRRPDVQRGLRALARTRLVWDLLCRPPQLPAVIEALSRAPGLTTVLEHLGKPPVGSGPEARGQWASDLASLAALPGTCAKVSELLLQAGPKGTTHPDLRPWIESAVTSFGFDRLMWGSGWPVCLAASSYQGALEAVLAALGHITDRERAALLGGTACRVYAVEAAT